MKKKIHPVSPRLKTALPGRLNAAVPGLEMDVPLTGSTHRRRTILTVLRTEHSWLVGAARLAGNEKPQTGSRLSKSCLFPDPAPKVREQAAEGGQPATPAGHAVELQPARSAAV